MRSFGNIMEGDRMKRNAATRRKDKAVERGYRAFIAPMAFCVCCGPSVRAVDLAHIRGHAQGYMKPDPCHTLPLCRLCHERQETNRAFFAPLTVQEIRAEAECLFYEWEVKDDAAGWLATLTDIHEILAMGRAA